MIMSEDSSSTDGSNNDTSINGSNTNFWRPKFGISVLMLFVCISVVVFSSLGEKVDSKAMMLNVEINKKLQGSQPIKESCVNLYAGDPAVYPETDALVVCHNSKFQREEIGTFKLSQNLQGIDFGISYVETGQNIWVTLFDEDNFCGNSIVIPPAHNMWLEDTVRKSKSSTSAKWAKATLSFSTTVSRRGAGSKASVM